MGKSEISIGVLNTLTDILNNKVQAEVYQRILSAVGKSSANKFKDDFGKGISALYNATSILNRGKGNFDPKPSYPNRNYANASGWQSIIQDELLKFNSKGTSYITSVSECLIKTLGLINVHQNANTTRTLAYYRGQKNGNGN